MLPGHSDVAGNETADQLAKQAAYLEFIGPEPVIGITTMPVHTEVRTWTTKQHLQLWKSTVGCRQGKMFLHGPDKQLARYTLRLKRQDLRILVGLLTGHIALNRHLTVKKLRADPLCTACGEEDETPYHFLGKCCARMIVRYSIFGAYLMELEELRKVKPVTLLRFARTSKRFS